MSKMFNHNGTYTLKEFGAVILYAGGIPTLDGFISNNGHLQKAFNSSSISHGFTFSTTSEGYKYWLDIHNKIMEYATKGDLDVEYLVQTYERVNGFDNLGRVASNPTPSTPTPTKPNYFGISVGIESYEARRLRKKEEEKILRKNDEAKALRARVIEMGEKAQERILETIKQMDKDFTDIQANSSNPPEDLPPF